MTGNLKLAILPQFFVRAIARGDDTMLVEDSFSQPDRITIGDRGWLFVSETESSLGDVVTLDGDAAGLDVPNWSMTDHLHAGAVLPWLDARWQARDVALLLDETREWRHVHYQATDAIVFAKLTLRCAQCGWTGSTDSALRTCPKCSSDLKEVEIFGNQEASFPLDAEKRFVETRSGLWDHDHCLICADLLVADLMRSRPVIPEQL